MKNPDEIEINGVMLDVILEKHDDWILNKKGGERANLSYADLRYVNLRSADLRHIDLSHADLRF